MILGFSGEQLLTLLGLLGAGFLTIGKAIQWYVDRLDKKAQLDRTAEAELRKKIEESFEHRIDNLEREVNDQKIIIAALHAEKLVYLRRIYQLEAYVQSNKLSVPMMEGWPP
jgi:predicted RNase H-like nuclease (RuvC/YqgF family)